MTETQSTPGPIEDLIVSGGFEGSQYPRRASPSMKFGSGDEVGCTHGGVVGAGEGKRVHRSGLQRTFATGGTTQTSSTLPFSQREGVRSAPSCGMEGTVVEREQECFQVAVHPC